MVYICLWSLQTSHVKKLHTLLAILKAVTHVTVNWGCETQLHSLNNWKIYIQWNLDLTKCQGTGEIDSLYRGSFPYITLLLGWKISFVISRASLYRGSLNRGSTVYWITVGTPNWNIVIWQCLDLLTPGHSRYSRSSWIIAYCSLMNTVKLCKSHRISRAKGDGSGRSNQQF